MAIGSAPEIGVKFSRYGQMTEQQKSEYFRTYFLVNGDDLMRGIGTVCHPDPERMAKCHQEWADGSL